MRDLVRNNPHAAKAVAVLVNNIIGAGIMPRAASGDDKLDGKADALFTRWTADCDADGQLDFYGLQTLICREMVEAGEVLVRRRLRRASDGLPVPLQLQVLEADFLDATKSGALGAGRLVQGIEFDPVGKRRAYWLHAEHPGDAYGALQNGLQSRPVPATEIAHVYEKQRTQARGVPWGAPVIRSLRDLDDYEVAELVRKKTEACVTAIVFGDDEAQQGIAPSVVDADGNRVEQFEPGLIAYARGGKDIRFNQPSATGGYGEYKRASLHTISAGFRVPYELLTGDLSQVNYSSIRAGLVEFRRMIDAVQWQLFIPMLCAPVWRWFTEAAWAAGQIPSRSVPVEWSPPKFEAVDPQKDAMANLLSIRSGTMTLAEVIARQGRNPDAVLAEMLTNHAPFSSRHRIVDTSGRVRPVAVIAHSITDATRRAIGTEGFYLDLTDAEMAVWQRRVDDQVRAFRDSSGVIEQAKGMISLAYGVSADRAFEVMRWRSQTANVKVNELARSIVTGVHRYVVLPDPVRQSFDHLLLNAHLSDNENASSSK